LYILKHACADECIYINDECIKVRFEGIPSTILKGEEMQRSLLVILSCLLLVSNGTAVAQIVEGASDLSAFVGIAAFRNAHVTVSVEGQEETQRVELEGSSEWMFGARYNYNINMNSSFEGTFGIAIPENLKAYFYHVNYRYNITAGDGKAVPFVTFGAGAVTLSPDEGDSETDLAFNFGGGFEYFASEALAVRFDVRDFFIRRGDLSGQTEQQVNVSVEGYNQQMWEYTGGITYYFK
jgi:hypothetical protein